MFVLGVRVFSLNAPVLLVSDGIFLFDESANISGCKAKTFAFITKTFAFIVNREHKTANVRDVTANGGALSAFVRGETANVRTVRAFVCGEIANARVCIANVRALSAFVSGEIANVRTVRSFVCAWSAKVASLRRISGS